MTELILARHGETAWNVTEVFRGHSNVELNDVGIRQAELLADFLSNRKIEAVYSSPMARALRMAEIIAARHNLRAVPSEGITDMSFGEWESRPVTEVQKNYPKLYAEWVANPHLCRPPGGDSLEEVRTRAVAFVDWVIKNHRGYVVLVSHRVVHKLLVLALLGLDNSRFWAIKMDTAAVTTFTYGTRGYVLAEHNNTSFLAPLAQPPRRDF